MEDGAVIKVEFAQAVIIDHGHAGGIGVENGVTRVRVVRAGTVICNKFIKRAAVDNNPLIACTIDVCVIAYAVKSRVGVNCKVDGLIHRNIRESFIHIILFAGGNEKYDQC